MLHGCQDILALLGTGAVLRRNFHEGHKWLLHGSLSRRLNGLTSLGDLFCWLFGCLGCSQLGVPFFGYFVSMMKMWTAVLALFFECFWVASP